MWTLELNGLLIWYQINNLLGSWMMWNWFIKMLGKDGRSKRKKVFIDIPYEQHRFSLDDFARNRPKFDTDDTLELTDLDDLDPVQEVHLDNK